MNITSIILLLSLIVFNVLSENCNKYGVNFYEDLGCKPISSSGDCPRSFDCSSLNRSSNQCVLKGKRFNIGEKADEVIQAETCNVLCGCTQGKRNLAIFGNCGTVHCPEEEEGIPPTNGCYRKYEYGQCCSSGTQCEPFDKLATCEYNGEIYREGEKFETDTCESCICQKGFTGKLEEPFCYKIVCGNQLSNGEKIDNYCAPVYGNTQEIRCCPYYLACPTANDTYTEVPEGSTGEECKFGNKVIKIGQIMRRQMDENGSLDEIECECKIPPFLTCTRLK